MGRPDIQRLFATCVRSGASEMLLLPGKPPVCRFVDTIRTLAIEPLTGEDVAFLAIESLAPNLVRTYQRAGFCRFDHVYRHHGEVRFRVFVIRHGESDVAILTPLGPEVPELEYADEARGGKDQLLN
jgi:Tfp pilus assembly pilus retraction ATPase PilT